MMHLITTALLQQPKFTQVIEHRQALALGLLRGGPAEFEISGVAADCTAPGNVPCTQFWVI